MMINTMYATRSQGFGLPKESQTSTLGNVNGLDTRLPSWWIRHPQVMTYLGKFELPSLILSGRASDWILSIWVAWVGSQRKRPQRAFLDTHCLAATQSTLVKIYLGTIQMVYTFLIAGGVRTLSDLKRIRTVSLVAQSESLARKQLAGLPLVFVRQTPIKEVAL